MDMDEWKEERASYRSDNLPTFLRLSRILKVLELVARTERLSVADLVADLVAITAHLRDGTPLIGQPVQIPPSQSEVR